MDEKGGEGEGVRRDGRRCQESQFRGGRKDGWRETRGSTVAYNAMFWYNVQSQYISKKFNSFLNYL